MEKYQSRGKLGGGLRGVVPTPLTRCAWAVLLALGGNYGLMPVARATEVVYPNNSVETISGYGWRVSADDIILQGKLTMRINGDSDFTFEGGLKGGNGSSLFKEGTGTLFLSKGPNTYLGKTQISAGTLALSAGGSIASSSGLSLTGDGSTFDISAAGADQTIQALNGESGTKLTLGANRLTVDSSTADSSYEGVIDGTGGLTKAGANTLTLHGDNTYTGATEINAGILALSGPDASIAASNGLSLTGDGSTFDISDSGDQTIQALNGESGTKVILGANRLTVDSSTADSSYAGVIDGTGGITKAGTNTLTLRGNNTYLGETQITGGTLALSAGGSIASSSGLSLTGDGSTFDISAAGADQTIQALNGESVTKVILGDNRLTVDSSTADSRYDGVIDGTGGLTKAGTSTLTLSGNNTYTGVTEIKAGTLALSGADASIAASSGVSLTGAGATLDLSFGNHQTIKALSGVSGTTVKLGDVRLTVDSTTDSIYNGVIKGEGGLTKAGPGLLILNGINTYRGDTIIDGGTLEVGDSAHATASLAGMVQVNEGGTLRGHGTILGDVINNGGTVRLGGSIGILTINGNYMQSENSVLLVDVSPSSASQLKVIGDATLGGKLSLLFGPGTYAPTTTVLLTRTL